MTIVDTFRECLALQSRRETIVVLSLTVGLAGALYAAGMQIEMRARADVTQGTTSSARRNARERAIDRYLAELYRRDDQQLREKLAELIAADRAHRDERLRRILDEEEPFPIGPVLIGLAGIGIATALFRRPRPRADAEPHRLPRALEVGIHGGAALSAAAIALLGL